MDGGEGGLNLNNWVCYDSPFKNLQHMTNSGERKLVLGGCDSNPGFHQRDHYGISTSSQYPVECMRDPWHFNLLSNHNYAGVPSQSLPVAYHHHPMQMFRQRDSPDEERMVQPDLSTGEIIDAPVKKRSAPPKSGKTPKTKKPKKATNGPKEGGNTSAQRAKSVKKTTEVIINGIDMDISSIPIPVCSCTSVSQQCYRWGSGGWQSACCTTGMSMYPLPMSAKRRGARIAGRKMSLGAFKKVLEKLAAEGYNFSNPIDLKTHWAKHGTNKFVTIR